VLPGLCVAGRALGLDQAERLAVGTPQHVVDVACLAAGHPVDGKLAVAGFVEGPAGFEQVGVDELGAGGGFVVVVGVRFGLIGFLYGSEFGAGFCQLLFQGDLGGRSGFQGGVRPTRSTNSC